MTRLIHASCAVRDELGVLIRGRPGSGKSDLLLRLLGRGFQLVGDDYLLLDDGVARAPERLRGLIEVRGLGIYRLPYRASARIGLVVESGTPETRIGVHKLCPDIGAPVIRVNLLLASSGDVVSVAVSCLVGSMQEIAGPLTAPG